jgi:type I restriction enzyme S subunit
MSSDWRSYRLDEVGRIVTGKTPKGNVAEYVGTDVPFVTPPDFDGSKWIYETARRISSAGALSVKNNIVPAGSVLVTCIGSDMGKAALTASACVTNQQINAVVVDQEKFCPEFLYYNLSLRKDEIRGLAGGSAQPILNKTAFGQVRFDCPPLAQQKEISAAFGPLDDRITLLRETNATLEAIAQALFKSWFVDFDPVHAKAEGRQPEGAIQKCMSAAEGRMPKAAMDATTAALFPDSFEESELGLVPRGWAAVTMADVSTVGIGKTPPRKESQWFSEDLRDVRWVSIRDMGASGVYASQTSEYLTPEAVEKFNVRRIPDNTVLMSFKMTIGRVAITDGEMTTNEAIAHFRLDTDSPLSAEYIYLHLRQFDFSRLSSTSSIADAVNSKTVREIPILVPGNQVAAAFQDQISTVFAILKKNEQQAQTLTQLRDTLLPRLISGQLRLPEAEQCVEEALA